MNDTLTQSGPSEGSPEIEPGKQETTSLDEPTLSPEALDKKKKAEEAAVKRETVGQMDTVKADVELARSTQNATSVSQTTPSTNTLEKGKETWWGPLIGGVSLVATKIKEVVGTLGKSISDGLAKLFGKTKEKVGDELEWGDLTDEDENSGLSLPEQLAKSIAEAKSRAQPGERIAAMAEWAVSSGQLNDAKHCWDWIQKVCKSVGMKFGDTTFRTRAYGSPIGELKYGVLGKGDWLYVHNGNKSDSRGDHSVIFLGWSDEAAHTARVASFPGPGKKARLHTIDFNKTPITSINKPALA